MIYSNCTIAEQTFVQKASQRHVLRSYTTPNTTGYNGVHDVIIDHCTFEGIAKYNTACNLLTLWHCNNIIIKNCTFKDCYQFHAIELNGCQNVVIDNCRFLGYNANRKQDFREQIQIDFSSEATIFIHKSKSKCYDNTPCKNIKIENCYFDKSDHRLGASRCIGNHCQGTKNHSEITIAHNTFVGYGSNKTGNCIQIMGMNQVQIYDNTAKGFGRFLLVTYGNYVYDKNGKKIKKVKKCSEVTYENNRITNPTSKLTNWKYHLRE